MRSANANGKAVVVVGDHPNGDVDVIHIVLDGSQPIRASEVFERWDEVLEWADGVDSSPATTITRSRLGPPSPRPSQVFAIGLNYSAHAEESGLPNPKHPTTFTKFPTCLAGPRSTVELSSENVDYEIELVVVIGRRAHRVARADAWNHIAGLMVGQDLSDREVQMRPPAPQFSLGKSFPGFGPTGPWLTTVDDVPDRNDLRLTTTLNGDVVQDSRTSDMIFDVPAIVEYVSHIVPMLPGDLVFTGTPAGVGMGRTPPRYLRSGDMIESEIEGLGTVEVRFE